VASIYLAWHQSVAAETALSLAYANDALHRAEITANQFAAGARLSKQAKFPACSRQDIDLLRQIDLGSSYIRAAGRVSGNTLLCTSAGILDSASLGKPNLISGRGVAEYYNVKLSPEQWNVLDVFSSNGFAILIDPTLISDISTEGPDVELAVFVPSAANHERIAATGQNFPSTWFQPIAAGSERTISDHGYLVTCLRSAHWDLAVVSAIPEHYILQRVRHFALIFTPIGVLCGLLLGWAADYIARLRSSFPVLVRRAIKKGEFSVEYQPIVELRSRLIIGAEALVRWKSSIANFTPDLFIPMADDLGLSHLITDQVLTIVARDLPRIIEKDTRFEVSINMSVDDLSTGLTVGRLDHLLNLAGAQPENLGIEATERAFLHDPNAAELIGSLRMMGMRVTVDDFGISDSGLACLQSLAVNTLKIDKAFIETISGEGGTQQVILHIIEMAHSLRLEMVAEGVETETEAEFLAAHGVRFAQGWLFGRPMPIDELLLKIKVPLPRPSTPGDRRQP
jgi:sensor c-di-GMP phosphodiesterase-like protein